MAMLGGECSPCCGVEVSECCRRTFRFPFGRSSIGYRLFEKIAAGEFSSGQEYSGLSLSGTYSPGSITANLVNPEPRLLYMGLEETAGSGSSNLSYRLTNATVNGSIGGPERRGCFYGGAVMWVPVASLRELTPQYFAPPGTGPRIRAMDRVLYVYFAAYEGVISISPDLAPLPQGRLEDGTFTPAVDIKLVFTEVRFAGRAITSTRSRWYAILFPASTCATSGSLDTYYNELHSNTPERVYAESAFIENSDFSGPIEIDYYVMDELQGSQVASGTQVIDWPDMISIQNCPPCEGACCETDGSCNIKPQHECDTDNGAVFAGVGEGCHSCGGNPLP